MREMEEQTILDGNAFYELDLECVRRKEKERKESPETEKKQENRGPGRGLRRR